jgi:oligoribonuclease NrnB/cAMP/cGMP phosphodiesterase (DHH superfamily)
MNVTQNLINNILKAKTVYYHSGCPDGIIAREFIFRTLTEGMNKPCTAVFEPYFPGNKLTVTDNCVFIDVAPIQEQYEDFLKAGSVIMDHHITNKPSNYDELDIAYPDQLRFGLNANNESGAQLAFECLEFHLKAKGYIGFTGSIERHIANLIAIGDCWDTKSPFFEKARFLGQYIAMYGNDYDKGIPGQNFIEQAYEYGRLRKRSFERTVKKVIIQQFSMSVPERVMKIAFMNTHDGISDVSEILRIEQNIDLIVGWIIQKILIDGVPTDVISYSLRSNDKFDCSKFAKYCNIRGGGHPKAAGFIINLSETNRLNGMDYFMQLLATYSPKSYV